MRIVRRSLAPNEIDHELVWLGVSVASLGLAAGWFALGLPWPRCAFHDLTGLPCITCGMTRCAVQFSHGHLKAAFQWNPLVFLSMCALSLFNAYALIVLVAQAPRLRIAVLSKSEKRFARIVVISALALNWIYLLSHAQNF